MRHNTLAELGIKLGQPSTRIDFNEGIAYSSNGFGVMSSMDNTNLYNKLGKPINVARQDMKKLFPEAFVVWKRNKEADLILEYKDKKIIYTEGSLFYAKHRRQIKTFEYKVNKFLTGYDFYDHFDFEYPRHKELFLNWLKTGVL